MKPKANAKPTPKREPVCYSVTIFVNREGGADKGEMLKHYLKNRDAVTFFDSEREMRTAQEKAVNATLKAYGSLLPPEQKGGKRK